MIYLQLTWHMCVHFIMQLLNVLYMYVSDYFGPIVLIFMLLTILIIPRKTLAVNVFDFAIYIAFKK